MSEQFHVAQLLSLDWWFRDRTTGDITVAQFPNVALWIFAGSVLAGRLLHDDTGASDVSHGIGTVGLAWWALDEVVRGVNPWRRLLGVAGLLFVPIRIASLLG